MERGDLDSVFRLVQDDARFRQLERRKESNLHIQREVLRAGQAIDARDRTIKIERDTVMVFADDAPLFNWAHPCRYLLYDAEAATPYQEVEGSFPPYLIDPPATFIAFHEPVVHARPERLWPVPWFPRYPIWPRPGNWYAVLFSGASNNRHTNDLEFLYRSLRNDYGIDADRIYVLNYDGTINYSGSPQPVGNWPGDDTAYQMTVNGEGTKSELDNVLDDLKSRLNAEDSLLVHTNNHGGHNGESYLCTYSGDDYGAADFGAKLAELPEFSCLMVMMEQCHSGGFNSQVIANSTASCASVASACVEANNSIGGADFDPFARGWISAMHQAKPDGGSLAHDPDTDGDGAVQAEEAFAFADSVHDPYDTPVYDESSEAGGDCTLGWSGFRWRLPPIYEIVKRLPHLPIPEALARLEKVLPEIEDAYADFATSFNELREGMDKRIAQVLETGRER
ncbi:MAG TPA: C13 family peptidase [Actinomycetota bacterium]